MRLGHLSHREALRYLGAGRREPDFRMQRMLDDCEEEIRRVAQPRFLFREVPLPDEKLVQGYDLERHLQGCRTAILFCATLGADIDRLLRIAQVSDMARAVVLDSMASVAIEQACRQADELIAQRFTGRYLTFRFSPGYGDYPISMQKTILSRLDAPRKIGLTATDNYLLVPAKSVTAVVGVSNEPIEQRKRGCAVCNLRHRCAYRRNGEHCGF